MDRTCDICKMEFTSIKPNPAVMDAQIVGSGGMWGYVCEGHQGYAHPTLRTVLNYKSKPGTVGSVIKSKRNKK